MRILGFFAVLIATFVLNGVALEHLWNWFAVPLGLHVINFAWAIGLASVVTLFENHSAKEIESFGFGVFCCLGQPLVVLVIGGIAHHFI
jgi:hypothetical protein